MAKPKPPSKWFAFLLVLSIAVLSVLFLGYFGTFGVVIGLTPPPESLPAIKSTSLTLDAGRVRIWTETDSTPRAAGAAPHSIRWEGWRPRFPDIRRSIWEFDNHPLAGSKALIRAYIVAFPIWLLALPFLIAPAIYLRRRLKNRPDPEGFAVVGVAGGNPAR